MSRRRLFVPPAALDGRQLTLTGADHHRIARVLRLRAGDAVSLFDGAGREVGARIAKVGRAATELTFEGNGPAKRARHRSTNGPETESPTTTTSSSSPTTPIVLICAVPRGSRMDFLVQKSCELGVSRIVPITTQRSVVRPEPGRQIRWTQIAREAARQSERADVPTIDLPLALAAALALPDLPARRVALWEGERARSFRAALASPGPTALLVGPEGGFAPEEIDAIRAAGFMLAGLGPRILRVETAAVVAVALAQEANGGLGGDSA